MGHIAAARGASLEAKLPRGTLWVTERILGIKRPVLLVTLPSFVCATFSCCLVSLNFSFLIRKMQALKLHLGMPKNHLGGKHNYKELRGFELE